MHKLRKSSPDMTKHSSTHALDQQVTWSSVSRVRNTEEVSHFLSSESTQPSSSPYRKLNSEQLLEPRVQNQPGQHSDSVSNKGL